MAGNSVVELDGIDDAGGKCVTASSGLEGSTGRLAGASSTYGRGVPSHGFDEIFSSGNVNKW